MFVSCCGWGGPYITVTFLCGPQDGSAYAGSEFSERLDSRGPG